MQNNIISRFFNNLGGFFGEPVTVLFEPKTYCELVKQSVCSQDAKDHAKLKECDLYLLGTFDNISGELISCKEFVSHCSDLLPNVKEGVDHA